MTRSGPVGKKKFMMFDSIFSESRCFIGFVIEADNHGYS